jgi:hypothetical protein
MFNTCVVVLETGKKVKMKVKKRNRTGLWIGAEAINTTIYGAHTW